MTKWYAISVRGQLEDSVVKELLDNEIIAYCPKYVTWKMVRKSSRKKGMPLREKRSGPIFPGYVFLKADLNSIGVATIRTFRGIFDFVRMAGFPVELPTAAVEAMERSEREGRHDETLKAASDFLGLIGHQFRITSGSATGYLATLMRVKGKKLELELSGSKKRLKIRLDESVELRLEGELG